MTALLALCALTVGVLLGQVLYDKRYPTLSMRREARQIERTIEAGVKAVLGETVDLAPAAEAALGSWSAPVTHGVVEIAVEEPEPVRHSVSGPGGHRSKRGRGKRR